MELPSKDGSVSNETVLLWNAKGKAAKLERFGTEKWNPTFHQHFTNISPVIVKPSCSPSWDIVCSASAPSPRVDASPSATTTAAEAANTYTNENATCRPHHHNSRRAPSRPLPSCLPQHRHGTPRDNTTQSCSPCKPPNPVSATAASELLHQAIGHLRAVSRATTE